MKKITYKTLNWEEYTERIDEWYKEWKELYIQFKDSQDSRWMSLFLLACEKRYETFILLDNFKYANECIKAGIEVSEMFLKKYETNKHKKMTPEALEINKLRHRCKIAFKKWLLDLVDIDELKKYEIKYNECCLETSTKKAEIKRN